MDGLDLNWMNCWWLGSGKKSGTAVSAEYDDQEEDDEDEDYDNYDYEGDADY